MENKSFKFCIGETAIHSGNKNSKFLILGRILKETSIGIDCYYECRQIGFGPDIDRAGISTTLIVLNESELTSLNQSDSTFSGLTS